MKMVKLSNRITNTIGKATFQLKKHSPEILIITGIVGTIASTVMACKATTKASDILDKTKEELDKIHKCASDSSREESTNDYTKEDEKKDLAIVYVQTGVSFIKLYAPSIVLGSLSIASILASHKILKKRNIALAAAYATVDGGFKNYRSRVVDRFGEEVDRELRYNIKAREQEENAVDSETGEVKKVKKEISVASVDPYESDYARFFDDGCKGLEDNSEYNLMFLKAQQNYANDLLKSRGYLFLNEVYDMLGIPKSKAGQIVGWIYDPTDETRDNYVDFGIYDTHREKARDFVNGYEKTILLDFNVDGTILDFLSYDR